MRIEFKEHELERALEQYLQIQFNKEVKVNGFDLSGMRSKEGLSAMVDITLVGETDQREPKEESTNVKPTNTSWREDKEEQSETKVKKPELVGKDLEDWTKFLELITDNAQYKNYDAILDLVKEMSESLQQRVHDYPLYVDMITNVENAITALVQATEPTVVDEIMLDTEDISETDVNTEDSPIEENNNSVDVEEPVPEYKEPVRRNLFGTTLSTKPLNMHNYNTSRKLFK